VGEALGWLAARLRLRRITGYICAGVLLSPSVLPVLDRNQVNELTTLGLVLLGVIGFAIGCSIRLKDLTGLGRAIAGITIIQGFLACGLTIAILLPFGAALYVGMDGAAKAELGAELTQAPAVLKVNVGYIATQSGLDHGSGVHRARYPG